MSTGTYITTNRQQYSEVQSTTEHCNVNELIQLCKFLVINSLSTCEEIKKFFTYRQKKLLLTLTFELVLSL